MLLGLRRLLKSGVHYFQHFEFGMVVTLKIPFLKVSLSFKGRRNNEKAFFLLLDEFTAKKSKWLSTAEWLNKES